MKMKFRYLVNSAMLWTALALGSCADFLDREPYSEPVDESYWNSEEDVEAAVAGGYGLLWGAVRQLWPIIQLIMLMEILPVPMYSANSSMKMKTGIK